MATKRTLDGSEDLTGWDVMTCREQVRAFGMFAFIFAIGLLVGVTLAKAGVF